MMRSRDGNRSGRRITGVFSTVALAAAGIVAATPAVAAPSSPPRVDHGNHSHSMFTPAKLAAHNAAAVAAAGGAASPSDLTYHNGPVMRDVTNYLIFWNPTATAYASNYQSVLERYFTDVSSTPFMNIVTQFGDSSGLPVPSTVHLGGSWVDTSNAYPHAGTFTDPVLRSDVQDEINRAITANSTWQAPGLSTMYFVFLGPNIIECKGTNDCFAGPGVPSSAANYCAYHSYFDSDKVFATMPYVDSSTVCGGNAAYPNGQAVDLETSPTSHEQFEAYSDPHLDAWYNDTTGNENGDNCAYTYGQFEPDGTNLVLSGHEYQSQIEWSNQLPNGCVKRYGPASVPTITGSLNFGVVPRGTTATQDISVANTGSGDLNLLGVHFAPGTPSSYSLSPAGPGAATLPPGHSQLFHVSFSPSATATSSGPITGNLRVDTDQPGVEQTLLPMTASIGLPGLQVTGSLDFGTVPRGTSAIRTVGVQNIGTADLSISNISIAGDPAYTITPTSPTSGTLPPGGFLTVDVDFAPPGSSTSPGPLTATLTVTTNDPSTPTITVPATGVVGLPKAVITPDALDFATACPTGSTDRSLVVTNTGTAPLTITSITLGAGSSSLLSVVAAPTLPQTLAVGAHLAFTVRLTVPPGTPGGPVTGTVVVATDDPANPTTTLPVTGQIGAATLSVSAAQLAFGGVAVDDRTSLSMKDLPLTLSNSGTCGLDLAANALSLGGANAGDFSIVGAPSLPLTLPPGASVQVTVRFDPSAGGQRSAVLTITPSAPATSVVVALTGTGLLPAVAFTPASITFAPTVITSQAPGFAGVTTPDTITNVGQAELILDSLSTTGDWFSTPGAADPPARLATSDHLDAPITFAPDAVGRFVGSFTVADSGPGVGLSGSVALCGEGVQRGIRVLAVDGTGKPLPSVARLRLQSKGTAQLVNINEGNLQLVPVPTSCDATAQRQYENQSLPATDTTNQRSSYYTLSLSAGGKSTTVTFTLGVAEFKTMVVTVK